MIPKSLFFVWCGDVPKYVNYCIENFKNVNPDFTIRKYFFTEKDAEDSKELKGEVLKYLNENDISYVLKRTKEDIIYSQYGKDSYKVILSESIRYKILYTEGGIYLDCDTFPIKPFDESLLELENFSSSQCDGTAPDCFFMGLNPSNITKQKLLPTESGYSRLWGNTEFIEMCKKFVNCELKYGDHFNDPNIHYIDHYWWRKIKYKAD